MASVLAALQWRNYISGEASREAAVTTQTAAGSLRAAIQRDEDLVQTLRGVVASGVPVSNPQLQSLFENVEATEDAGTVGLAYIERVPSSDLDAFEAAAAADPPLGVPPASFAALRGDGHTRYCLIALAVASKAAARELSASGEAELESGLSGHTDYCDGPYAGTLHQTAATGKETVRLLSEHLAVGMTGASSPRLFAISVPVYQPGLPTSTTAERESALLGWATGLFSPVPLLGPVVSRVSGLAVTLRYANPSGPVTVATAGPSLSGSHRTAVTIGTRHVWSAEISVVPPAVSATVQGVSVMADLLVIVLLIVLILSLSRSRRRAIESLASKNRELEHRASHDSLTGLPNRDLVLEMARAKLERAERDGTGVLSLLIDLDGFNAVNDTFGHRAGDQALEIVAALYLAATGLADTLGRLAGDEFVVLAEGPSTLVGPEAAAERLLTTLSDPIEVPEAAPGTSVRISACVGVARGPGISAEELLRDAGTALNEAKSAGRGRYVVFEPAMHDAARERLALTSELRLAADQGHFHLVYQPISRLEDRAPVGVEALLRWRHPIRGVVPPLDFVPVLEETGMITEVGREVLRMACTQAKRWEQRGLSIFVSVNASALQLESDQFCDDVRSVLAESGLDPARLTVEITESAALMRAAHDNVRRLSNLKALGIRLAIDDFGTGYSSLAYLRQFPVDVVKIDRSFIRAMTRSTGGMALVRTMLDLGRALNLETVAEGIEEEAQLHALELEHCTEAQGFLLAKPLAAEQIEFFFDHARPRGMASVFGPR